MNTPNRIFSPSRMMKLAQHHFEIDRKTAILRISGFCITIVLLLFIGQIFGNQYRYWSNMSYYSAFLFFYIVGGIYYAGFSFKWLRTKESRQFYLILPATPLEKFIYELVMRIFVFLLLVPPVFWILANLEGYIFSLFADDFVNYRFSFLDAIKAMHINRLGFWGIFLGINSLLLPYLIMFTGATFFKKNPIAKTLLSFAIIVAILFLFGLLLFWIFGLKNFHPHSLFFMTDEIQATRFAGVAVFITNITALTIAYFNVKEKEV